MVSLDNLLPGMVLAADVHDKSGRLLLGEGVELETKHLFIFRTWGIVEADIAGMDDSDTEVVPDDITPEEFENAKKTLLPLYCHANIEHPAISELLRLAVIREVKHVHQNL
jgi:hypothetical protein